MIGKILGAAKLRNMYCPHFTKILGGSFLKKLPKEKKSDRDKYTVLAELPTRERYEELRTSHFSTDVQDLITEAFGEATALRDELQEWYDNLPESLQSGEKADALDDAINQLDSCDSEPDWPEGLELRVVHLPGLNLTSRSKRMGEVLSMLDTVLTALSDYETDNEELQDAVNELRDNVEEAHNAWENVEFPGMY